MMLIVKDHWGFGLPKPMTIEEAVDHATASDSYYAGELERIKEGSEKTTDMLARLISTLHASGALADHDVVNVIGKHIYKIEGSTEQEED